jgi:glutamate 5-kinase
MSRNKTKIIVIKLGTRLLTSEDNRIDEKQLRRIVSQIGTVVKKGVKPVIVTSGSIAAGMGLLGFKKRPQLMPDLQASAAVGQSRLMQIYDKLFSQKGLLIAQVLLTQDDLNDRRRYVNAKNTINRLLAKNVIPVINENDTVSTEEIKFGDNDRLSGLVAGLIGADKLIMLTDVKGLYDENKKLVCCVKDIDENIRRLAKGAVSGVSKGGMVSKLETAHMAGSSCIKCFIASGREKNIVEDVVFDKKKDTYTSFLPKAKKLQARKSWIRFASRTCGAIYVDAGAENALKARNKSLLASGIVGCEGSFKAGSAVDISVRKGERFAIGLTNFSSDDIQKIKGLKTHDVKKLLGEKVQTEVVHKDNLVLT